MRKMNLLKHFMKLLTFLLSLMVVVSLTLVPVYAKLDSEKEKKDKPDKAAAKVLRHMEKMEKKFPKINGKKKQVEEELDNGTVTPFGSCSRCHTPAQGAP
ncbi:MAG: hypothetical protein JRI70_03735 [Deltaproteobacteria bacterium]|nr:hypothetical protein [Deltaproteobacteria bacterium]MBW1859193.1 hypothetical protein [Deltaproteobacteria bacterium]